MGHLYVVGGQQRGLRSILAGSNHWYEYQKGIILRVDEDTQGVEPCLDYVSPAWTRDEHEPTILFKCGTVQDDHLYLCTQTEILVYALPSFEPRTHISLPCFNDLHHVRPAPNGHLLVANTGLDMVLELTREGDIVREWSTLGENPWARWDKQVDYRKGINTKPHKSHPNYLFYIDSEPWVTRFQQRDAISLADSRRRIAIGIERPHDGVLAYGRLYFTTVDAHVVIADPISLEIEEVIDLNSMHESGTLLGWCRSILVEGSRLWVGFSRLRATKFRDNVSWVKRGFKHVLPTRIACYDLAEQRCVAEINLEPHGLNAVFGIFRPEIQPSHLTHSPADAQNVIMTS